MSSPYISARGRLSGTRIAARPAISVDEAALAVRPGSPGRIATSQWLDRLIRTTLAGRLTEAALLRFGADSYYLPSRRELALILRESQADRKAHMLERYDCDDFAYAIKGEMTAHAYDTGELRYGLCVGLAWGRFDWLPTEAHAINWAITSDEAVWFIEPQTDDIYPFERCVGGIRLLLV
ncbi:lectin MOA-related protein [Nannocystis pusilla]|uniref:lectin MOA-related protein n=1 Tax=Nannocystis pusilla TaxID=889268 RepID=UPI003DA38A43